jgi:hypothetical protein
MLRALVPASSSDETAAVNGHDRNYLVNPGLVSTVQDSAGQFWTVHSYPQLYCK